MLPMSKATGSKQRNDERLFFYAAIIMSLLIGTGFFLLLFALNSRDETPPPPVENSGPVVVPPDHPRQLADFSLTDRTGRTVTRAELDGKFLVVSFLFTSCSLTCPVVSGQMAAIQQLATNLPDVQLVSLTVDPDDDTVPVLAKYGGRFGADTNRWLFLTGNDDAVRNLIGASFLAADTNSAFAYMPGNFDHIEHIALVDPQGRVRDYFDGLDNRTPEAVVKEILQLNNQH